MLKNKLLIALAIAACSTVVTAENKEINYSVGLKNWNHYLKDSTGKTNYVNTAIISLTAKKDTIYMTGSIFLPSTYKFSTGGTYMDRSDADIALGWMVKDKITLLGGIKKVNTTNHNYSGSNTNVTDTIYNFNYVGVNFFNAINENQFLYGTVTRSLNGTLSRGGVKTTGNTITTFEAGIGHTLSKETQLTLAFRNQDAKLSDGGNPKLFGLIFGANFGF